MAAVHFGQGCDFAEGSKVMCYLNPFPLHMVLKPLLQMFPFL